MDHQSLEAQLADLQARLDALEKQKRRRWRVMVAAVVLATSVAVAGPVTMTQFTANTPAVAAQINANFNNLNARIEEVNASLQASIPTGTIAFFAASTCPASWAVYNPARGRAVVGLPSGGTVAGVVAGALTNVENRAHNHEWASMSSGLIWSSFDAAGNAAVMVNWADGMDSAGTGIYPLARDTGGAITFFTQRVSSDFPYIQLLACMKN